MVINCPKCNRIIMDTTEDGYKLRSRMVLLNAEGKAEALCPSCKTRVVVPLLIDGTNLPPSYPKPKFIIDP